MYYKELLAVLYFIEYYRQYLLGRTFTVRTDHQVLIWLFSLKEPKGRIARWVEILSAFDLTVEYRPGSKHGNANDMSRCLNSRECDCPETDHLEYMKCDPCAKRTKRTHHRMSSLKTYASNISSKETEVLNAVKTKSQTEDENIWTIWKAGQVLLWKMMKI